MSEKIKTAIMEIIKAHMVGEDKNTKAVLSDVMESVNEILEQEPCDDAISREDRIKDLIGAIENDDCDYWTPTKIASTLKQLPSVTPSRRNGHWIDTDEGFSPCECSECKSVEFKKSKFCPNCGARMESEDKE